MNWDSQLSEMSKMLKIYQFYLHPPSLLAFAINLLKLSQLKEDIRYRLWSAWHNRFLVFIDSDKTHFDCFKMHCQSKEVFMFCIFWGSWPLGCNFRSSFGVTWDFLLWVLSITWEMQSSEVKFNSVALFAIQSLSSDLRHWGNVGRHDNGTLCRVRADPMETSLHGSCRINIQQFTSKFLSTPLLPPEIQDEIFSKPPFMTHRDGGLDEEKHCKHSPGQATNASHLKLGQALQIR